MAQIEKIKSFNSNKKKIRQIRNIVIWLVLLTYYSLFFTTGVYSKYYSKGNSKGVTAASGLYFSSDCLNVVDDSAEENKIDGNCTDFTIFSEYANAANGTETTEYTTNININNYENQLLYNDSNLDITYDVFFRVIDDVANANIEYSVTYLLDDESGNSTEQTIMLEQGAERTNSKIEGQILYGGAARSNQISVKITKHNDNIGVDDFSQIAIWAIPTKPEYVTEIYKIGTLLRITEISTTFACTTKFEIENDISSDWTIEDKNKIDSVTGFTYDITVSGNPPEDKKWMKITWNTDYLEIYKYNEYYIDALENGRTGVDIANKKAYMIVELDSYSYMRMIFYKSNNFNINNLDTISEFKELINCYYE